MQVSLSSCASRILLKPDHNCTVDRCSKSLVLAWSPNPLSQTNLNRGGGKAAIWYTYAYFDDFDKIFTHPPPNAPNQHANLRKFTKTPTPPANLDTNSKLAGPKNSKKYRNLAIKLQKNEKKSFIFIFDQCLPGNGINPQKSLSFYRKSSFLQGDFPGLKIKFSIKGISQDGNLSRCLQKKGHQN